MDTNKIQSTITLINENLVSNDMLQDVVLDTMLENIGNTNSELRDDTIYSAWGQLLSNGRVNHKQKMKMLRHIIDNKTLFIGINQPFEDTTFERAFSSLLLVQLLNDHYKEKWIPAYTESHLVEVTLNYMMQEKDNRGFVEDFGWAHAFAHGADLLGAIAKSPLFSRRDYQRFLESIKHALIDVENFHYGEEGRLAEALVQFIESQDPSEEEISNWIIGISDELLTHGIYNACWKNFLMSFYFSLNANEILVPKITNTIEVMLKRYYQEFRVF